MFGIACFGVLVVIYWVSALLAELLLPSAEERALPAAARTGVGLLWLFTVFSAGWQLFSPELTWLVMLALLALWLGPDLAQLGDPAWWRKFVRGHGRTFLA